MKKMIQRGLAFILFGGIVLFVGGCGQPVAVNKPIPQPEQSTASVVPASSSNTANSPSNTAAPTNPTTPMNPTTSAGSAASLANGKELFEKNCVSCHGANGIGATGPALNKSTLVSGEPKNTNTLVDRIKKGNISKGMLAWENVIPDSDIEAVTQYLMSLK